MPLIKNISLFLLLLVGLNTYAQRYNMSNATITACQGTLVDSEEGKDPGVSNGYGHNENFCFTICVPGSPQITLVFSQFELEEACPTCDYIRIYDGPNSGSPLIGQWGGTNSPGTVTSTGSCITICFRSDNIVSAPGFELSWNATPPPPIPPVIQPIPNVNCNATSVVIQFDTPIPCSQLIPGNFAFSGPAGATVSSVTPINCSNGSASSAQIGFSGPLNQSGTYNLTFTFNYVDICGNTYRFQISASFSIINCPLQVQITGATQVCQGSCTNLTAVVSGGNPANYQYSWAPGGGNTQVISVCPSSNQTYTVTVSDGVSQPASATHSVSIIPVPEAGPDVSMCRFAPDLTLSGTPAGGNWFGPGIINNANGTFRGNNAGAGTHWVYYVAPNGCYDSLRVTVHPVSAGGNAAACTGSPSFQLNGAPAGGTWTGTNVTPGGVFTPSPAGTYTLTYTEPNNNCTAQKTITVVDSVKINGPDTIVACDKQSPFQLSATPNTGRWTGPGVTNQNNGTFDPASVGQGVYTVIYTINGCSDSVVVRVNTISAGNDTLVCPLNAAGILTDGSPQYGVWTGPGIVDNGDSTFTFNPASLTPDATYTLTYTFNGCADTRSVFLYYTRVAKDTLKFCSYDSPLFLANTITKPNIPGGQWSGVCLGPGDSIRPANMSPGLQYVYYEYNNNGCIDSLPLFLTPKPNAGPDIDTCPRAQKFLLNGLPSGGIWQGPGITNAQIGEFDPYSAGLGASGDFPVTYEVNGCFDTTVVHLKVIDAKIIGYKSYYCLDTSRFTLNGLPPGGSFSGPGIVGNQFVPQNAGPGLHQIVYTYGAGDCIEYDTVTLKVLSPLNFDFQYDNSKLCYGDSVRININLSGGDSTRIIHYLWDPDKGDRNFNYIRPSNLTTFSLTVTDGCSTPVTKSAIIDVYPEILFNTTQGDTVCFGQNTWAKVNMITQPATDYRITWLRTPPFVGDSLYAVAGKYDVEIRNKISNCFVRTAVKLPGYKFLNARLQKYPDTDCVPITHPMFSFINLSTGADRGYWSFGDGDTLPYSPDLNPEHVYQDTGEYKLKFFITNAGGCTDSIEMDLCVEPVQLYFIPNAFTPNSDGKNDVFPTCDMVNGRYIPKGYGVVGYEMEIFDRWGELRYQTDAIGTPWNGRLFNDGELQKGEVYVYKMTIYYSSSDYKEIMGRVTLVR